MASRVRLFVVVDDITVQGVSASEAAKNPYALFEQDLGVIANIVTGSLETDVGGTVSEEKSIIIGSSEEVVTKLTEQTGSRWACADATRNLGVDVSYTGPSCATQRGRTDAARAQVGRFAFLRGFVGQVAAVVRGGIRASMVCGSGVQGATEAALARTRSTVGACAFGPLGGASLTLRFMTAGVRELDPAFDLTLLPLKAWATAIWDGKPDAIRKMAIAFNEGLKQEREGVRLESRPPGPTVAVLVALRRLGWHAEDYQSWVTDRGTRLQLRVVCPRSVWILGRLAVQRCQWQHVAAQYPDEFTGFEHGGDVQPVLLALGPRSPLTPEQKQLAKCAFVRRLWPDLRRAQGGYQESGLCDACREEVGTLRHALFRCPAVAMARYCADLGPVGVVGARAAAEHHLFSRGVMPDLRHLAPLPTSSRKVVWDPLSRKGIVEGHVFWMGPEWMGTMSFWRGLGGVLPKCGLSADSRLGRGGLILGSSSASTRPRSSRPSWR